jgi:hypothetical protein
MRTGGGSANSPVPRYAWVSIPEGLIIASSSSPRATACARTGEPVAMRSHGRYASPDPLPTVMQMSRLP